MTDNISSPITDESITVDPVTGNIYYVLNTISVHSYINTVSSDNSNQSDSLPL